MLLEPDEPPKNLGWDAFEGTRPRARPTSRWTPPASSSGPSRLYSRDEGCSVTGGYVYQGLALPAVEPLSLRRFLLGLAVVAEGGARWAGRRTSGASARRCRSSPTRPRRRRRARVRLGHRRDLPRGQPRRQRADRPVDPHAHAVTGMPGRKARAGGCAAASRWTARGAGAGRGRERALDHDRFDGRRGAAPTPIATDSGRSTTSTSPASSFGTPKRPSSHSTIPPRAVPGSTSASPRNSASQRVARPLVDLLGRADLLDAAVAHDGDTVGQRERLGLVVRHEQRGRAGGAEDRRTSAATSRAGRRRGPRRARRAGPRPGPRRAPGPARPAGVRRRTARAGRRPPGRASPTSSRHSLGPSAVPRAEGHVAFRRSDAGTARRPARPSRSAGAQAPPRRRRRRPGARRSPTARRRAPRSRRSCAAAWSCPSRWGPAGRPARPCPRAGTRHRRPGCGRSASRHGGRRWPATRPIRLP